MSACSCAEALTKVGHSRGAYEHAGHGEVEGGNVVEPTLWLAFRYRTDTPPYDDELMYRMLSPPSEEPYDDFHEVELPPGKEIEFRNILNEETEEEYRIVHLLGRQMLRMFGTRDVQFEVDEETADAFQAWYPELE